MLHLVLSLPDRARATAARPDVTVVGARCLYYNHDNWFRARPRWPRQPLVSDCVANADDSGSGVARSGAIRISHIKLGDRSMSDSIDRRHFLEFATATATGLSAWRQRPELQHTIVPRAAKPARALDTRGRS